MEERIRGLLGREEEGCEEEEEEEGVKYEVRVERKEGMLRLGKGERA